MARLIPSPPLLAVMTYRAPKFLLYTCILLALGACGDGAARIRTRADLTGVITQRRFRRGAHSPRAVPRGLFEITVSMVANSNDSGVRVALDSITRVLTAGSVQAKLQSMFTPGRHFVRVWFRSPAFLQRPEAIARAALVVVDSVLPPQANNGSTAATEP